MTKRITSLLVLLCLFMYNHGFSKKAEKNDGVNIEDTTWKAISIKNESLPKDLSVTISFAELKGNSGRVSGNSGCNRFTGQYYLSRGKDNKVVLGFSRLATTMMACTAKQGSQVEKDFLSIIPFVKSFFVLNGKLSLQTVDGKVAIVLMPFKEKVVDNTKNSRDTKNIKQYDKENSKNVKSPRNTRDEDEQDMRNSKSAKKNSRNTRDEDEQDMRNSKNAKKNSKNMRDEDERDMRNSKSAKKNSKNMRDEDERETKSSKKNAKNSRYED